MSHHIISTNVPSKLCSRSLAEADSVAAQRGKRSVNFLRTAESLAMRDESSSKGKQPHSRTKAITPSALTVTRGVHSREVSTQVE